MDWYYKHEFSRGACMPLNQPSSPPWLECQHRPVRDLAWACFSAPMVLSDSLQGEGEPVQNAGFVATAARLAWLEQLDREPARLLNWLAERPATRLGLYFEALWQFFLEQDDEVELLAHNLPVRAGGRTIGEFDCLYYCHRRQSAVHLELAVKFYLHRRDAGGAWDQWLGPNSRDRLDLKLERLLNHQSQLSLHRAACKGLAELDVRNPLREVEVKGYLFQHILEQAPATSGVNSASHLSGWCHWRERQHVLRERARYRILPRLQWLAPARADDTADILDAGELERVLNDPFSARSRALLVAEFDNSGLECCRFFICADDWPG